MKIGNTQHKMARWGKERYKKMMELGFEAMDFSNDITDRHANCVTTNEEFLKELREDKKLIDEAGIFVHQMHGPWRWPPRDNAPEDRADSTRACQILPLCHVHLRQISKFHSQQFRKQFPSRVRKGFSLRYNILWKVSILASILPMGKAESSIKVP